VLFFLVTSVILFSNFVLGGFCSPFVGISAAKAVLHVMFIAQQPGEIYGKIAVSTTAGH